MPDAEIQDEIWQDVDSGRLMGITDPVFREDAGFLLIAAPGDEPRVGKD